MNKIVLSSPAKINLYLKVLNKRPDRFHNILTLFQRINLCDELSFQLRPDEKIRIICAHPHVPTGSKNLVYRVVTLIRDDFAIRRGVEIYIKKVIPVAAGLAGGSSNAATALLGINKLFQLNLSRKKLLSYARMIGSDVAFFLHDCAWGLGTGRGDVIKKCNIGTKLYHILVVPRKKIYAGQVYESLKLQLTKKDDNVNILIRNLKKGNIIEAGSQLVNDLESAIIRICPSLLKLKVKLKVLKAKGVMISGSGPSVFGITETKRQAEDMQLELRKRYSQVFVVRTL